MAKLKAKNRSVKRVIRLHLAEEHLGYLHDGSSGESEPEEILCQDP